VLEALGINWAQALTHLISFLIALWLLKKYAWGPIMNLLDERRQKIADEFQQIDDEKSKVSEMAADYEAKLKNIENERRAEIVKGVDEGKKLATEIKENAQKEARELAEKSRRDLEREIAKAKVQLRDDMVSMTMSAAEKVIHERLDEQKHRELIGRFIEGLEKA
jgi:F-type H+-transporting ATPase subunit b